MASNGRPPKPIEQKMLQGTFRQDRLPSNPIAIQAPSEPPAPPMGLSAGGMEFWAIAWQVGWISPASDKPLAVIIAEQITERDVLRQRVIENNDPRERTGLRELEKQLVTNLGQLGFSPAERSRLGLATVKAETKLEALLRRKAERS